MNFTGDSGDFNRAFWTAYANRLIGSMGQDAPTGYDPNAPASTWFIPAAQGMLAQFTDLGPDYNADDDTTSTVTDIQRFNGAVFDLANRLPQWAVSWTGASDGDFFATYLDIVRQLRPNDADPSKQKDIDDAKAALANYEDDLRQIQRHFEDDYKQDNMTDGRWNDGYSPATMRTDYIAYKTTPDYQQKFSELMDASTLDRLQLASKIMQAQEACFGSSFAELSEALNKANSGDPMVTTDDATRARSQMQIADGSGQWEPDYRSGPDNLTGMDNYNKWLSAAQADFNNKAAPNLSFTMQQSEIDTASSEVKTQSSVSLPFADIFVGSAGESTDTTTKNIAKEDFDIEISIQDLHYMPLQAGAGWYDESILAFVRRQFLPSTSTYVQNPMSGPNGSFNLRVVGVLIAVGRSITYTAANYTEDDWSQDIDAHASCSLLGIFTIGGGDYHSHAQTSVIKTKNDGYQIADTTNAPTIIGVVVQQIPLPAQ